MRFAFYSLTWIAGLVFTFGSGWQENLTEDTVVATVNGKTIEYREIMVSDARLAEYRKLIGEGLFEGPSDPEALRLQLETNSLSQRIHRIVRDQKKKELNISVSDQEIQQARSSSTGLFQGQVQPDGTLSEEARQKQLRMYEKLIPALEAVQSGQMNPEAAYAKFQVDEFYPMKQWKLFCAQYDSPEKIDSLRTIQESVEQNELKVDYKRTVSAQIEAEKLSKAVDEFIARNHLQYKRFIDAVKASDQSVLKDFPPDFREQMQRKWWEEQYRSAKVEIHLERYQSAR